MNATDHRFVQWKAAPRRREAARMSLPRIAPTPPNDDLQTLTRRYDELTAIAVQLIEECSRLRADNDDLRASAEIWIKMYENQVDRANSLEQQLLEGPRRG